MSPPLKRLFIALTRLPLLVCLLPVVLVVRMFSRGATPPRVFFGATSIFVLPHLAAGMRARGHGAISGAVADLGFPVPPGFDKVVRSSASHSTIVRYVVGTLEAMAAFVWALRRADIFAHYMDGGFLRRTPLQSWEVRLLRLAGKRVVLFPYGTDAWSLERVPDPVLRAALAADYPALVAASADIAQRLDHDCAHADAVVGCLVHNMVLPRCDALMLTCYGVETDRLTPSPLPPRDGPLRVFHAPNHTAIKGTACLVDAVAQLQRKGVAIELDLVQRVPRAEVLARMRATHVVVDQLLCGYGMTALEGMALGRIVISGENWAPSLAPFLAMPAFQDNPIHWASPATIADVLDRIATNPDRWDAWAARSRAFAEAHHSPGATAANWAAVFAALDQPRT